MSQLALQLIKKEKQEHTGKLDLGNCGLTDEIPKDVFECTWLEELSFSNSIWDNRNKKWINSPNIGLPNRLNITKLPKEFEDLQKLKILSISGGYIKDSDLYIYYTLQDCNVISKLTSLQSLDLRSNQINDINFLKDLTNLQILDLRSNKICNINFIKNLFNLEVLNLRYNQISNINFLKDHTNLKVLDLSDNQISDISFLKNLTKLEFLDLHFNQINDINFIKNLTNLKEINLRNNQISNIRFLKDLINLKVLDLYYNQISDVSFLKNLSSLKELNLQNNQINDISFIKNLTNLQELNLRNNKISNYHFIKYLMNLRVLDLSDNQIRDVNFLKNLTRLEELNLYYNKISDISFLKNLTNLQVLKLRNNQISDISHLKNLTNLKVLDLRSNQICDYSFLKHMKNLQVLDVRYNKISNINFLKDLKNLQVLDIRDNLINEIKPIIQLLRNGIEIKSEEFGRGILVKGNPITTPPMEIIKQGREAVVNWFEQIEEQGKKPLYEAKLMILGQGGAGKTTFANLQLNPDYKVEKGKEDSTLGIVIHKGKEYKHQKIENQAINANLWDFGGQDIQKMLHQFFITEDCLYVLVSDKRAENTNFDYWFQIVSLLGPNSSVIVLENPIDITSNNEDFALNKYREQYNKLTIESTEVNLLYTKTGDKHKWEFLNKTIEDKLSQLEIVNRNVPSKWGLVRNELDKLKKEKFISLDFYHKNICEQQEIGLTKEEGNLCLSYLRSIGDLIYFKDRDLSTRIFLDHEWITKGMYYILSDTKIKDEKGRFTRAQAYRKWDDYDYNEEEKSILLHLLLKDGFDICYELPHIKDVFITPILLPNDKPVSWDLETNLQFRYRYEFMPHGMFSRLIVKLHEKIEKEMRWKTGVRLLCKDTETRAEIQLNTISNQQVIDIKLNGSKTGCKKLLNFVRKEVEDLHKDYKNITYRQLIGCNCDVCISLMKKHESPTFYRYNMLQSKLENRSYFVDCEMSGFKEVNIGQILNDIIIENAGIENNDNELLYKLKEMGMSINQIKNENKIEMSDFGKANATSNSSSEASAEATANVEISIEIQNILDQTDLLKEDIEDEREVLQKEMGDSEINTVVKKLERIEKEMEALKSTQNAEPKSKTRFQQFVDDMENKDSKLNKVFRLLSKGKDYGIQIAELYNKVAQNTGLPSVPPLAIEAIKKL